MNLEPVNLQSSTSKSIYDAYYYAHNCGEPYQRDETWLTLFRWFAERIAQDIQPKTVLDAGCAMGLLVECLRERGISAWGIDISEYAIQNVPESIREYCHVASVTQPFTFNIQQPISKYDLIVCIEVLEHLDPREGEKAVVNLCQFTDDILFSSTPLDYTETSHQNVQPLEYWAEMFARQGFFRDVNFDASFIAPWAIRFRRKAEPPHRLVREYERRHWWLWKENTDLRQSNRAMHDQLAADEVKIQDLSRHSAELEQRLLLVQGSRTWRLRTWLIRWLRLRSE